VEETAPAPPSLARGQGRGAVRVPGHGRRPGLDPRSAPFPGRGMERGPTHERDPRIGGASGSGPGRGRAVPLAPSPARSAGRAAPRAPGPLRPAGHSTGLTRSGERAETRARRK
jgi:hypothetical protein